MVEMGKKSGKIFYERLVHAEVTQNPMQKLCKEDTRPSLVMLRDLGCTWCTSFSMKAECCRGHNLDAHEQC